MRSIRRIAGSAVAVGTLLSVSATVAAHPDGGGADDGSDNDDDSVEFVLPWEDDVKSPAHDEPTNDPDLPDTLGATGVKNISVVGRGERNGLGETTDVWAHDGYAYTGTFNDPCGGDPEAGIWVWDVHNPNKVEFVTVIQSPTGSRTNDVRVAEMNSGDILVHSNESCGGGPGGFEIYDVNDPANPVYLSSVRIDEQNPIADALFGGVTDVGVHNLFLFTQGDRDLVAVTSEGVFDNFQIWDLTDPADPTFVSSWGAEELFDPGVSDEFGDDGRVLAAALDLLGGYGASQNKFLHDVTVSADGNTAYLANWDAGLVRLDISDPANPVVISVAIDPVAGSLDGEVNSHSVWPNEDGTIVIEGEEDFSAWEATQPPSNVTFAFLNDLPGVIASTSFGDIIEADQTGRLGRIYSDHVDIVDGADVTEYPANEFADNNFPLGDSFIEAPLVWAGQACAADPLLNQAELAGAIAVVRRGACAFSEKSQSVADAGAVAVVVTNNNPVSTPWSGFRIWDYSDPANPILASTFDTECSASTEPSTSCVAGGTYSSHNVIVETQGDKVYAYIAWYNDGVVMLDISDPYDPVEVARYLGTNEEGVLNDFWGIYKEPNSPFLYASDRNGGLYVLKVKGKGRN